jgi:hypothetical protein
VRAFRVGGPFAGQKVLILMISLLQSVTELLEENLGLLKSSFVTTSCNRMRRFSFLVSRTRGL